MSMETTSFCWLDPGQLVDDDLELVLRERIPGNSGRRYVPEYRFEMHVGPGWHRAGYISLRVGDNDNLRLYAGHIGYRVEPPFRGHHYAARSVKLVLPLAKRHGINPLWITCNPENIASRRSCELAGGEFVEIVSVPEGNEIYRDGDHFKCRYKFNLD
jgi:tagatose 1,6-diphosphate aldolase